jgi:hypothetical protein
MDSDCSLTAAKDASSAGQTIETTIASHEMSRNASKLVTLPQEK